MKSIKLLPFLALVIPFIFFACDESDDDPRPDYVSLHIGDIKQYVSYVDSTAYYSNWEVVGVTTRPDGQKVYAARYSSNDYPINDSVSVDPGNGYYSYYFIRDGYYYATQIVPMEESGYENNPYNEQRLAKVSPVAGETWVRSSEDPATFKAHYVGEKTVQAGTFTDVYAFTASDMDMRIYYARDFGHIGSSSNGSDLVTVNYIKVNGNERGTFVPPNSNMPRRVNKIITKRPYVNFFGQVIK